MNDKRLTEALRSMMEPCAHPDSRKEDGIMAYRWSCPHEWLRSRVDRARGELAVLAPEAEGHVEFLVGVITALLADADPDAIQDTFQEEMDQDGYFEEIKS